MKKQEKTKQLLLLQLEKTPIVQIACEKVGVSRMTFYRWKNGDAEFGKKVDRAINEGRFLVNDLAESQLISAVKERNFSAIAYWLRHHHPSYKTKIELEGMVTQVHELSPEQEVLVQKALALAGISIPNGKQ